MVGNVYDAVVVQTKKVPAGEGVQAAVDKSEIIHTKTMYLAKDDSTATSIVASEVLTKIPGLDLSDPVNVVEIKLRKY